MMFIFLIFSYIVQGVFCNFVSMNIVDFLHFDNHIYP